MRKMLTVGLSLLAANLAAQDVVKEGEQKVTQEIVMDTVVVTAKRIEQDLRTGDVDTSESSIASTTIQRQSFEGSQSSLADVIQKESGIQIRQSGGLGSYSAASLRGSSAQQTMVFMDGIPLNDAAGGGVDLSTISLGDVANIEIYRGATPINFSSSSIGGAINIKTLRAGDEFKASTTLGYGSFGHRSLNAFVAHKPSNLDYLFSLDHQAADNDFEIFSDNGTPLNGADDGYQDRNNAAVDQNNLLAKLGYSFSPTTRLDFINQFFDKEQEIPSWNNAETTETRFDTQRFISSLKLSADALTAAQLNTSTTLTFMRKEEHYDDSNSAIGLGRQDNSYKTDRINGDFFIEYFGEAHHLIATANILDEVYSGTDHLYGIAPAASRRRTYSLGIQDSIYLLDETLIITPAARQSWNSDSSDSSVDRFGNITPSRDESSDYFSPQLGISYAPRHWIILRSNAGKYVRQPSFFELFGDRGLLVGNDELKAENGKNVDLGAELQWQDLHEHLTALSFELTYFNNRVDDLITQVYDARGVGKSVNVDGATVKGFEVGASAQFLRYFNAALSFTSQDPINDSEFGLFNGKQLPGLFSNSFFARLEASFNIFTLYGEFIRESEMYYDTANLLKAEDKKEYNAGLSARYKSWLWKLEGNNLGDNLYEDFNGFPRPGRSFYTSLTYLF